MTTNADSSTEQLPLIPRETVLPSTGKTLESLQYSRQKRDEILRMFGGELPMSIMAAKRHGRDSDIGAGTYGESEYDYHGVGEHGFRVSGKGVSNGALSQFPQNIGRSMILLYTKPFDTIVDPFAGHNSRMELCVHAGRHYIGQDLSHEFMEFNRMQMNNLSVSFPDIKIVLFEGDSRKMQAENESGDFTLTSPPYWDIEYYGDEPEQLGNGKYEEFLHGLSLVAKENYRCLKPSSFCVWFVNDFRKNRKFYAYHVDTLQLLQEAGFVQWDILITDLGYPIKAAFATQVIEQRILPKRHEYGIIVRKPPLYPMDERKERGWIKTSNT